MYYLFSFLLMVGGGPKYHIDGHFYYTGPNHPSAVAPALQICQNDRCTSVKMSTRYEFDVKLRGGTYELRYINQWHQEIVETLYVQSDQTLALDAASFRPRDNYPVWTAFTEHGVLSIAERTEEKGHFWDRLIEFHRMKGGIEVELYDPASDINKVKMLSPLEVTQLEDYLRKVDLYDGSLGCDVSVLYLMQAGEETFIIEHGSCDLRQLDTILYDLYVENYVSQEFP